MPTMMNSPFNLEYKITYDELSPSLQDMFKSLQSQISDNRNEINNLNDRCDDLEDACDNLENRIDKVEDTCDDLQDYIDSVWSQLRTSIVPIGFIIPSQRVIPGWVKLDGSLYSRTDYADLYNYAVENKLIVDDNTWYNGNSGANTRFTSYRGYFSYGDGSTNFRVPDLRDCFIRGTDDGRGYDRGRNHMTEQLPTLVGGYDDNHRDSDVGLLSSSTGGEQSDGNLVCDDWSGDYIGDASRYRGFAKQSVWWGRINNRTVYNLNTVNGWYAAIRPRNIAYYYIMKAQYGEDLKPGQGTGGGDDVGEIPDYGGGEEPDDPTGSEETKNELEELKIRVTNLENDIPIGTVRYVYIIPNNWIEMNGQLVNRSDYPELFDWANTNGLMVSETEWNSSYSNNRSNKGLFSYGDNSTTFRLPDFRSRFIRGLDNGVGYDPDRLLGTEELPTLIPGYDNNDDLDYFKTNNITPDQWFIMHPGQTYTWANIGYLSTRSYENGVPGVIDYPDRDVAGCWSADAFKMTDYQGSKYSTVYSDNKSTRIDLYYTSSIRDRLQLGTHYGVGSKIDETTILPNTWYAASRPRNIALKAIIKYK